MQILNGLTFTFTSSFGASRTGKTVTATILDSSGNVVSGGFTISSVLELGSGYYAINISFVNSFAGFIKWNNTTDGIILFDTIISTPNNSETLRKIETNRWLISNNQLIIYDDDKVTPLYTWNLFSDSTPNGDTPNERTPV